MSHPPKYYVNLMRPYAEWDKDYFSRMEEMFAKAQAEAVATAIDAHTQHVFRERATMTDRQVTDLFEIWIYGGMLLSIPLQIVLQGAVSFWANLKDWNEDKRWEIRSGVLAWNGGLVGLPILVPFAFVFGVGWVVFNGPGWLGQKAKAFFKKKPVPIIPQKYIGYPCSMALGPYRESIQPCSECGSFSKSIKPSLRPPKPEPTTIPSAGVLLDIPRPPAPDQEPE